jgi:hypothetical protein
LLPPSPLRLLPAGTTVAGRDSHPLKMHDFSRRTRMAGMDAEPNEPIAPELPRRRFRKLRIFWSVVFGMLYLLLVALWVRSNSWTSSAYWIYSDRQAILLASDNGNIQCLWERNAFLVTTPAGFSNR